MKKNFFKHLFFSLIVFLCWISIVFCVASYIFLTTTWGAKIAATALIESYIPFCNVTVGSYQGTIEKGLLLKNVTISHIPTLKKGVIHIQELYTQIPLIEWHKMSLKLTDARINLPSAEAIIFNGTITQDKIKGNIFAHSIDARQVLYALGYDDFARNLYGYISNLDFDIQGQVREPYVSGHFFVDKVIFKNTTLTEGFGHLGLTIKSLGEKPEINGYVILESALLQAEKINIDLLTSKVDFQKDITNCLLDIHGAAKVDDLNIDIAIKGTMQRPQLIFNSDPPLPEEQIMLALVTGKSWSGTSDDDGVGVRKKLTDAFNVGMEVQEIPSQPGQSQTEGYSRTIEGQMRLTDKLSVNVARKFLPAETTPTTGSTSQVDHSNDSKFYLEYKQRF